MNELLKLDNFIEMLLQQLSPGDRKRLFQELAKNLRRRQQARMQQQTGPDGQSWPQRKPQKKQGNNRGLMMKGLKRIKHLKIIARPNGFEIGYFGQVAKIAKIHHYGLRETLNQRTIRYAQRELLGWSVDDVAYVRSQLMEALL